ncbi:menaquinone biosynthesis protein [Streptomyces sp. NPDC047002]|uniref:menaquinone biosynthesis protein n=1 Tax=Streptomyces sp. NPDC047002 TaxID=3155475 RepID=UPI003453D113
MTPRPLTRTARPRLGDISFLNCAPLRWALADGGTREDFGILSAPPEALAGELVRGGLDVSPVSLVQYLSNTDRLVLLPGPVIGSDGPVLSCHLVTRGASPAELDGATVALSTTSRSTVLLVRMLLEDFVGVRPRYVAHRQDLDTMLAAADAAVLIGDDALRLTVAKRPDLAVHDTGQLWRRCTGLPMVFAVWAVRRRYAQERQPQVRAVHEALTAAVDRARRAPLAVAAAAHRESLRSPAGPVPFDTLLSYYRAIDYSFGQRQFAAIEEFSRRAAAHGEVPAGVEPEFAPGLAPGEAGPPPPRPPSTRQEKENDQAHRTVQIQGRDHVGNACGAGGGACLPTSGGRGSGTA